MNGIYEVTTGEKHMLTIIFLLVLLIVFDIVALYWGYDSSDEPESVEWERRQQFSWHS